LTKAKSVSILNSQSFGIMIDSANLKKAITLRFKFEAEKEGIPYQTFITSILRKYATKQLVDGKLFLKFKELFVH